jgi:hypothetical protein
VNAPARAAYFLEVDLVQQIEREGDLGFRVIG